VIDGSSPLAHDQLDQRSAYAPGRPLDLQTCVEYGS
jgi:hypothetical protein